MPKQTSFRLTPATAFAVEWIQRVHDCTQTDAIAHALTIVAEKSERRGAGFFEIYHPHEGVRWCRMLQLGLTLWSDELRRTEFVNAHKPFFFAKRGREWVVDEQKIAALWPHVDFLADRWFARRELDAWAAGEQMQAILKEVKITPPAWGPKAEIER